MRFRYSIMFLWFAGLFANATGFLFTLLANRSLSLEQMGNFGFFTNIIALASIASVAVGVVTNRYQAIYFKNKQPDKYGYTASFGTLTALMGGVVLVLYLALAPWWTKSFAFPLQWPLLLATGAALSIMFPLAWLRSVWQAHSLFVLVGIGLLGESLIKVALGLLAGSSHQPFFWFMAAMAVSSLAALLIMYIPRHQLLQQVTKKLKPLEIEHWNFLGQTLIQRVGVISLLTIDILFAKYFLSPEQAGIYALLSVSGKIIYFLTQSLYVLVTPMISPYLEQTKKRHFMFAAIMTVTVFLISGIIFLYTYYPQYSLGMMLGQRFLLIQPYVVSYSLASGFLSLALIATLYKLLRKQYATSGLVIFGLFIEVLLMFMRHQTIKHLVENVLWTSLFLVIVLSVAYVYQAFSDHHVKKAKILMQ